MSGLFTLNSAEVEGQGLHTGRSCRVRFIHEKGPVRLRTTNNGVEAHEACVTDLLLDGSSRSTCVSSRDGKLRIGTVEHLFAALGALSLYEDVVVAIDGPEIPLVDGGARVFVDALSSLGIGISPTPPKIVIARAGCIDVGRSRYEFTPSGTSRASVEVNVDFDDDRLDHHATWDGSADDFITRIAPARTFGFAHEVEQLLARGLANHVARESVVVIAKDQIMSAGPPFRADEPARHKLLDLIGDLYAHGGPPIGHVKAHRPGHAATHEAMRRARDEGLLTRRAARSIDPRVGL